MTTVPETREAPQALGAERAVLAHLMLRREAVALVRGALTAEAFYLVAHQAIYRGVLALDDAGEVADLVTLAAHLKSAGQLEAVGGHVALSSILDATGDTSGANLHQHVRLIRQAYAQRLAEKETRRLSEAIAQGINGGSTISEVIGETGARLSQIALEVEPGARPPSLDAQFLDGERFFDPITRPPDLIGSGYFVAGGLVLIASFPGLGKTYLAVQAMKCMARAEAWLDFETRLTRSAMVQFETPHYTLQERFARCRDALPLSHWLLMPQGFRGLDDPHTLDQLCFALEKRKVGLVTMDPLHALHRGSINFDEDIDPFLDACHTLRHRTGVCLVLLHHINKLEWDKHASLRSNVLRSVKGSGRLTADPDTVIGLIERHGQLRLVNAKTRLGPSVESIAIRQDPETGWFERVATHEEVAEASDRKLEACLRVYGASGATLDQICEECGLSPRTAVRHLQELGAVKLGGGRGRGNIARYYLPDQAPQEEIVENETSDEGDRGPW